LTMRIGLVSYEYPPQRGLGGVGTYTFRLAGALGKAGHEVIVLAGPTEEARPRATTTSRSTASPRATSRLWAPRFSLALLARLRHQDGQGPPAGLALDALENGQRLTPCSTSPQNSARRDRGPRTRCQWLFCAACGAGRWSCASTARGICYFGINKTEGTAMNRMLAYLERRRQPGLRPDHHHGPATRWRRSSSPVEDDHAAAGRPEFHGRSRTTRAAARADEAHAHHRLRRPPRALQGQDTPRQGLRARVAHNHPRARASHHRPRPVVADRKRLRTSSINSSATADVRAALSSLAPARWRRCRGTPPGRRRPSSARPGSRASRSARARSHGRRRPIIGSRVGAIRNCSTTAAADQSPRPGNVPQFAEASTACLAIRRSASNSPSPPTPRARRRYDTQVAISR